MKELTSTPTMKITTRKIRDFHVKLQTTKTVETSVGPTTVQVAMLRVMWQKVTRAAVPKSRAVVVVVHRKYYGAMETNLDG